LKFEVSGDFLLRGDSKTLTRAAISSARTQRRLRRWQHGGGGSVTGNEMSFDYRAHPGPVQAGNARRLMRRTGLDVPLEWMRIARQRHKSSMSKPEESLGQLNWTPDQVEKSLDSKPFDRRGWAAHHKRLVSPG